MIKRKVLIPLDGSEFGRRIVEVVRDYFRPQETKLVLLHVAVPLVMPGEPIHAPYTTLSTSAQGSSTPESHQDYLWTAQEMEEYRARLQEELQGAAVPLRLAGYEVTSIVLLGDPAERIIAYVKEANIELVAMTTHGRTGLGRFVLGSVAESVLRHVDVPLLLLRTASSSTEKSAAGDESTGSHR
jgi:nucleotide-binding universal stress UspA family protein